MSLGGIFGLNAYDYFANAPLPITIGWGGLTFIDLAREGGLVQIGRTRYGADLLVNRDLNVTGKVVLGNIPSTGGVYPLCVNGPSNKTIAYCSSSLRYKTDVRPFLGGLAIIERLRPIAFTWKEGGAHDIGLGAEEVNRVEPLLTFRNDQGEIEGVRYNQLSAVFVNAFIEQQAQIRYQQKRIEDLERQQTQIQQQQEEITTLKALVCGLRPDADVCR